MDKGDKKKQEEALKSSFMSDRNAAFLDAASLLAQWGNAQNPAAASVMPFMGFPGLGMGLPTSSNNHQQQMAAAAAAAAFDKNAAMNQNWFAMAQMAAQDYFSRLQMSGMTGADLASLQALSGLSGYPNMNLNSSPSTSSTSDKSNSKRKEKSQHPSDPYEKYSSSLDVKKSSKEQQQKNSNNYNQSYSSAANLQKDFMAMAAALDPASMKDFKSMQGNYVPNKNSNANHNQTRGGNSNNNGSNSRKSSKDSTENNYSSKRNSNSDAANFQNLFKDSNNSSLLGVRLPPDTEIIKYTSSGSKMPIHNSFNQGSSLDIHISPKRKRMDTYDTNVSEKQKNDMVEVIKLPSTFSSNGSLDQKMSKDFEKYKESNYQEATTDDAPLNLCVKSSKSSDTSEASSYKNNLPKDSDLLSSVNNLSNLQNLTAGIGLFASNDSKHQKEGRPRNLGRGVSKPKKNTVASLLAQSRAVGIKPQQLLNSNCDLEKVRQAILDQQNSDVLSNTDSESVNDTSGISESDGESDNFNIDDLKRPLSDGWKRETIIKGLTKMGNLKGDVYYFSPYSPTIKLTNMHQLSEELINNNCQFTENNFSFSSRKILGNYLQAAPPPYATDGEFVKMTDYEVAQRLDEIRHYTQPSSSSASSQLNVEQRIEIARQQQALREAKKIVKDEINRTKEKAKHLKDMEKCEKYEQQRKEKELKSFHIQEAKRRKEEEIAKSKSEEQRKRQEEKERRRQHMAIIKQLEFRRKFEEREKKRHLMLLEKLISREQKLAVRKLDSQIMSELRKPKEDSEILNKNEIPVIPRINGLRLAGQGFADLLMAFEFLHNFGETLGFDMESLPSLQSLHNAITQENAVEAEEEFLSVMTHLLVCAIEDPGIPNPNRHTTLLGQTLRQADITHQNVSEILRIYLYAVATGEVRQQTGICMERDRAGGGRLSDLHQNDTEEKLFASTNSKNSQYFETLHDNERYKLSEMLKDKPYVALNPTVKAQLLGMLCNDLLLNKAVCKQIESGLESQAVLKREKFLLDNKVKKYKSLIARKQRIEQYEKSQQEIRRLREEENAQLDNTGEQSKDDATDEKDEKGEPKSPEKIVPNKSTPTATAAADESSRKSNLPDEKMEEDNSEEESEDLDEDEDATMTSDEVQKKLEKILEQCFQTKQQLHKALSSLRAKHYGQDRYWRRYWYLPKCGGIYVEGLESAESELLKIQSKLEGHQKKCNGTASSDEGDHEKKSSKNKSPLKQEKVEEKIESEPEVVENNFKPIEEVIKPKTIPMPPPPKVEESDDFDIEDSIPTAILVQKANKDDTSRFVEINHVVPSQPIQKIEEESCEEVKEEEIKMEIKSEDIPMENETNSSMKENSDEMKNGEENNRAPKFEALLPKWFSLIDQEIPLVTNECPMITQQVEHFKNIQCKDEIVTHGHLWEVQNNLHFYNPKHLCESTEISDIEFKNDSVLSTSGLDIMAIEKTLSKDIRDELFNNKPIVENGEIKKPPQSPTEEIKTVYDQSHNFNLPPIQNMTINNLSVFVQCENLNAPQMTLEEQDMVDEVKKHGVKNPTETALVSKELRHGWFKISEIEDMNNIIKSLHPKGVREKILRQNLLSALSESIDLTVPCPVSNARAPPPQNGYVEPEAFNAWNPRIAKRVEQQLLDQVEALEDKIANASMQIKGWNAPQRETDSESDILESIDINLIRDRILNLEGAIERRYLKPPLGTNTTEAQLMNATIGNEVNTSTTSNGNNTSTSSDGENVPKGLSSWREAVQRSVTSSQLSMALYTLEQCVAWDKSIMKANCQFCQSGESEDKLLLCDSCDRGYHTYCFKPKIDKIPEGDWFCFECINKATGERKCIICGGLRSTSVGKLVLCELCPRAYHQDCYIPPMLKVPRGKWYCANCASKAPPKKKPVRKPKELKSHNSSHSLDSSHDEIAPNSPTASMTSFLIDEQTTVATTLNEAPSQNATSVPPLPPSQNCSPVKASTADTSMTSLHSDENDTSEVSDSNTHSSPSKYNNSKERDDLKEKLKAEKKAAKKLVKEMAICKIMLEEMEVHEDSWPFLLPVNTKQFPTYKKVIKHPMDLSTIKKRLQDMTYKSRDDFVVDVRQIFDNCEVFNEDDSPVGKAGHGMRKYFELRWAELTDKQS